MAYQTWGAGGHVVEGQLTTFDKRLLSRFRSAIVFTKFGYQKGIPMHGGKSVSFRRLESILAASYANTISSHALNAGRQGPAYGSGPLALTEGTPGAAIDATWSEVICTVSQYGQYVQLTDMLQNQAIDDVKAEYVDNFGEAMAEGIDLVTRDILVAGTNVQYASSATSRATVGSGMNLSLAEVREAKRTLLRANARPLRAEGNRYGLFTHPDCLYDLEGDSAITNIWQHAGERGMENQLFDVAMQDLPFGVRLFITTNLRIFASLGLSGCDVYGNLMFGEEWYGIVDLDSMPAKIIAHGPGESGVFDPLDQVGTCGWKAAHGAVILNQNLGVRIETNSTTKQGA